MHKKREVDDVARPEICGKINVFVSSNCCSDCEKVLSWKLDGTAGCCLTEETEFHLE